MPSHLIRNSDTYQCTADAHNFVKVGQRCLANSTSFVRLVVENVKVVMIDVLAKEDIGNEFQEYRLVAVPPPHKKDGVWCICIILRGCDDPMLKKIYAAREYGQNQYVSDVVGVTWQSSGDRG